MILGNGIYLNAASSSSIRSISAHGTQLFDFAYELFASGPVEIYICTASLIRYHALADTAVKLIICGFPNADRTVTVSHIRDSQTTVLYDLTASDYNVFQGFTTAAISLQNDDFLRADFGTGSEGLILIILEIES